LREFAEKSRKTPKTVQKNLGNGSKKQKETLRKKFQKLFETFLRKHVTTNTKRPNNQKSAGSERRNGWTPTR